MKYVCKRITSVAVITCVAIISKVDKNIMIIDVCVYCYVVFIFFLINVGIRTSLRVPRLIPRALKLTIM
jgi:hypothetical protein